VSRIHKVILGVALLSLTSAVSNAFAADTLESLLKQVQSVRDNEIKAFEQRSAEYNAADPAQQKKMLEDALSRREALDKSSKSLSDEFAANELKINNARKELRDKASELGLTEIFGLTRQVAGEVSTELRQSLISTQFPPAPGEPSRDETLLKFSTSQTTPTANELENFWFQIQREMTASGQVAKYRAMVVQPSGESVESEVVRVGPFTAVSGGKFLSYVPSLKKLSVFPRQPPARFLKYASDLESATSGYVQAVVDSARGVLLALYVERPNWIKRIELGQEVGYVIITVGILGFLAFVFQLFYLVKVRLGVKSQLSHLDNLSTNNPLGRVLLAFKGDTSLIEQEADVAELRISEAVLKEVPRLERFQSFLRLAVAAGPLLGLIGTVMGMILTFQSITESGSSDPKLMATGIGQAMIATVLGLGIAIPLLFANALLNTLSKSVSRVLDEQSVGMLAESIEKQRRA